MNDFYHELLINRKKQNMDFVIRTLVYFFGAILLLSSYFFGPVSLVAFLIFIAAAYYFILPKLAVEFEYSMLNSDITIDIIYKKQKRKNLFSFDIKDALVVAPYESSHIKQHEGTPIVDCSSKDTKDIVYAIIISINSQKKCILINPDDKLLDIFATYLPRKFFKS